MRERDNVGMEALGNALTIAGIMITMGAIMYGRGRTVRQLAPWLLPWWHRMLGRLRRALGLRGQPVTIYPDTATLRVEALSPRISIWENIQPDDDLDTQLAKMQKNLDQLREDQRHQHTEIKDVYRYAQKVGNRITSVDQSLRTELAQADRVALRSDQWEIVGLLVALFGALLSTIW